MSFWKEVLMDIKGALKVLVHTEKNAEWVWTSTNSRTSANNE